jgi:Concanavalin A-like lectin/glucanases superfamily
MNLVLRSHFLGTLSLLGLLGLGVPSMAAPAALSDLMPRSGDHTSMWWVEGFPGVIPNAPWKRRVQTGYYMMEQDTVSLQFCHLGPAKAGKEPQVPSPAKLELMLKADGKLYQCSRGGPWSRFTGPRLIESGTFMQRTDVTDLEFTAVDGGAPLNVEARFETAAWPDRLGLIFAARPGLESIKAGEASFGKTGGGYGLTGTNDLVIPHEAALDPEQFTLELWVFVPLDKVAPNRGSSWLVCKNRNEACDGNYGIVFQNGVAQARMNIGGGGGNMHEITPQPAKPLQTDAWSHLVMSYDGDTLRYHINAQEVGAKKIGKVRTPGQHALAIGRREDGFGDGMRFKGAVDEIRIYDRALNMEEIRQRFVVPDGVNPHLKPVREWKFRADGTASAKSPAASWKDASLEIRLTTAKGDLQMQKCWELPKDQSWPASDWHQVSLALDPASFQPADEPSPVTVNATGMASGNPCAVQFDPAVGWFRVNLDTIEPTPPPGKSGPSNDAIERIKLTLTNPTDREQMTRLMFEKTGVGFRQGIGSSLTGISAILRDMDGNPTGIPVQLSKNWHNEAGAGVYAGSWFHGISQMRVPAGGTVELELTLAYGHWGGLPAASHSQLSLIGWGSNQLWHQSALGSWGESICYEPEQAQANCTITDVRPAMVKATGDAPPWQWTGNVGGGDFLRFFTPAGERVPHSSMRAIHHRPGPCLTEVTYTGNIGDGIRHSTTVSLARTDDIVLGAYQIRMDVTKPMDFSRFVVFQIGADTYNSSRERRMAIGNETGLSREWNTQWGGNAYRTQPLEATGRIPWASLHDGEFVANETNGPPANRGIVIRSWKARLGGKPAAPWMAERGLTRFQNDSSTLDIVPPPGITRLEPGDFIEATVEHIVMPKFAKDYYGPSAALRTALTKDENTWRMIHREAVGGDRKVTMKTGTLVRLRPDVRVKAENGRASLDLTGGNNHVPVTFTGLSSPRNFQLTVGDAPLDQSIHGNDFWQTDYDPATRTWSRTYNIPPGGQELRRISLAPGP